jgi:hypothetical protein
VNVIEPRFNGLLKRIDRGLRALSSNESLGIAFGNSGAKMKFVREDEICAPRDKRLHILALIVQMRFIAGRRYEGPPLSLLARRCRLDAPKFDKV